MFGAGQGKTFVDEKIEMLFLDVKHLNMYPSEKSVVELHLLSRVSLVSFALIR